MKEAAGEANMTVITIVLIAVVLAIGTVIVNSLMTTTKKKSCCSSLGGTVTGNTCKWPGNTGGQAMDQSWYNTNCKDSM